MSLFQVPGTQSDPLHGSMLSSWKKGRGCKNNKSCGKKHYIFLTRYTCSVASITGIQSVGNPGKQRSFTNPVIFSYIFGFVIPVMELEKFTSK